MLQCWRDVTLREYPDFVDLLPSPDDIDINKLIGGGIMTDTCSTAQLTNNLLSKEIDGKTHNLLCHNHLRNVWVKNVLESLTDFLRAHLSDSLDEIAPEFRVSPSFISFARAFDKMFSLCANYPKGWGDVFRQWMIENHPGELLFHVERAVSGGRQDIASMAAMAIYWNRNYCVEFLEEMRVHCGREENILANNLWTLLISVEMISVARMWSIFHISIVMLMCWLTGKTALQYKKDKEEGLKDNILMRFKGMGWVDAQTTWSKDGKKKTIPQLQQRLLEIIAITRGFEIRDKPPTKVPQRKQTAILGTLTNKVREMDAERVATEEEFDLKARHLWRERNDKGEGSVHQSCQLIGNRKLDASFLNTRIEVLTSFDIVGDDGKKTTQLRWCGGVVEKISDGTWLYPNARTRCYKENDAAFIYWDPVEECDFPASRSIQELKENKWNKDCVGAWRKDLGDETYGL